MALRASTLAAHPDTVPSSVAKMNVATARVVPLLTPKSCVPLKMLPVGVAGPVVPGGPGTVTTTADGWPTVLYSVLNPVPPSESQNGLPAGDDEMPQGLTSLASVTRAVPGISDTRLVCRKLVAGGDVA